MSALRLASARHAWRHPWQLLLALAGVALGVTVVTAVDLSIVSSRLAFERSPRRDRRSRQPRPCARSRAG